MKIKDVCTQTGLTERAVRFYIEKGLLQTQSQIINGRVSREYTEIDIDILKDISKLRKAGFSIQDIIDMQNSENNINDIICRHYNKLEEEQQFKSELINDLKEINKRGKISWRKLSSLLFNEKKASNIDRICFPLPEAEPSVSAKSTPHLFKPGIFVIITVLLLNLVIIAPIIKTFQNQKLLAVNFTLSDVIIEKKWIDNSQPYVQIRCSGLYVGYDDYFTHSRILRLKSVDQYEAIQVKSQPYMSLGVWLEMPYGVAKQHKLLDGTENIKVEEVLKKPNLIKEYCTIISMYQYE